MTANPAHAHGFSRFEKLANGHHRGHCLCGSFWTGETKPEANRLLGKHLRERAREFRKLRREPRGAS